LLRKLLGWQNHWLQFLPAVLGVVWVGFHWMHRRKHWEWRHELPILLLVSVVATSYGWLFDQIVLLPAVIQASVWTFQKWGHNAAFWTLTAYIGINLSILLLIALRVTELHYLWVAPTWLVGYAVYRNLISGTATQAARGR
jgi:hypothetical protein